MNEWLPEIDAWREAGLKVVMDRCPKIEIARLGLPPVRQA